MICRRSPWDADASLLSAPEEIALAKVLGVYPRSLLAAATALEPHRLAFYLQDLAAAFHGLWTRGKEEPACGSFRTKS